MGEDLRKRLHLEREQVEDQLSESLSGRPKRLTWSGVSLDRVAGRVLSKVPRQCSHSEKSLCGLLRRCFRTQSSACVRVRRSRLAPRD
ncbi:hypothetical protein SRHO_G00302980 [Serrasalmus rhombeus]